MGNGRRRKKGVRSVTGIPARRHRRKLGAARPEIPAPDDGRDPLADLLTKKRERIVTEFGP
jgi:hypothetical protein